MALKEMYDYLSTGITLNSTVVLNVKPTHIVTELGEFKDSIHIGDDGSEERILLGTSTPIFYASLYWSNQDTTDIGTVYDVYFNSSYGAGRTKTFMWDHPTDGYTYITRFESQLSRSIMMPNIHSIPSCKLRVLGRINDT